MGFSKFQIQFEDVQQLLNYNISNKLENVRAFMMRGTRNLRDLLSDTIQAVLHWHIDKIKRIVNITVLVKAVKVTTI